MSRRKNSDELDAALRADPDYIELCSLLDKQSSVQKARLEKRLTGKEEGEAMEIREDVDKRIVDLKEKQGLSFAKVAEQLNQEGYRTSKGRTFPKSSVQSRYELIKKHRSLNEAELVKKTDTSQPPCAPCETSPVGIPHKWIEPLQQLIKKEIRSMISEHQERLTTKEDIPPATPRKEGSKEYEGIRDNLPGCRIDGVLLDLFNSERVTERISASELMQRILWSYFGKPKLSFDLPAHELEELRKRFPKKDKKDK